MAKDMKFLKLEELRALATKRGIDVPVGATSAQIRAVLQDPDASSRILRLQEESKKANRPLDPKFANYEEKLKNEPREWVRVFNRDLNEGVDFSFTFERHRWHLINGEVVRLPRSVVEHLKGIHYPQVRYEQGEAGQTVKVEGSRHRFAITNVDAPKPVAATV